MTRIVETPGELRALLDAERARGKRIGFVPTMGALHAGHLSLVDAVRARGAEIVVVSIFVNPLQFGPREDLSKYPRTFEDDRSKCAQRDVDFIYFPSPEAMYPPGFETHVEVEKLTQGFEGAVRPTHFRGVTTVVLKLFNAVGPCIAAFGQKDYQQWRVVDRMTRDLDVPVEILRCPIAREPDGLAMSSRNRYLDPDQRARATAISRGLSAADAAFRAGERNASALVAAARTPIEAALDSIDYVTLADAEDLTPCGETAGPRVVMLVTARLGATRLLDNAILGEDQLV